MIAHHSYTATYWARRLEASYRPAVLHACMRALNMCQYQEGRSFSEVAVILNADDLNARNLYVAMTRGSKKIVVCSRTPLLSPAI